MGILLRVARAVGLSLVALVALVAFAGCAGSDQEFREIAPAARFTLLRETAAWSPGFDPAWWPSIDAAYSEYDADVERLARSRWEAHCERATLAMQREMVSGDREARALRATQRALDDELGALERGLVARLERALPGESRAFTELLGARMAFERASVHWLRGDRALAAPIEVLATTRDAADSPFVDAAIAGELAGSYRRLSQVAAAAFRRRSDAYMTQLDEFAGASAALAARTAELGADPARAGDPELQRLAAERAAIKESWQRGRDEADESLRLALVRESLRIAPLIPDAHWRARFESRGFETLHEGAFSMRSFDAAVAMGRRVVEREKPGDAERLAEFDAVAAASRARESDGLARMLAAEAAGDRAGMKAANDLLRVAVLPVAGYVRSLVGEKRFERLTTAFNAVREGRVGAAEAVESAYLDEPPQAEPAPPPDPPLALVDASIESSRDAGLRAVVGSALSPRIASELARALALDEAARAQLEAFREAEAKRLAEGTQPMLDALKAAGGSIRPRDGADGDASSRARDAMRSMRAQILQIASRDAAANARFLEEAARVAGSRAELEDGLRALAAARLELELEAVSAVGDGRGEVERLFGIVLESAVSPIEIVRRMRGIAGSDEGLREAAIAAVLGRAEEFRAAAAALREGQLRNIERFLLVLATDEGARQGMPAFRPEPAGPRASELRFEVAADLRAMLGSDAADAYLEALRRALHAQLDPARPAVITAIERLAAGARLEADGRAATRAIRQRLASVLETAEAERRLALLLTHRWRASWVLYGGDLGSGDDWRKIFVVSPTGHLLRARIEDIDQRAITLCEEMIASESSAPPAWLAAAREELRGSESTDAWSDARRIRALAPLFE